MPIVRVRKTVDCFSQHVLVGMISELLKGGSVSSCNAQHFVRQYVIDRVGIDRAVYSRILFSDKNQTSPMALFNFDLADVLVYLPINLQTNSLILWRKKQ